METQRVDSVLDAEYRRWQRSVAGPRSVINVIPADRAVRDLDRWQQRNARVRGAKRRRKERHAARVMKGDLRASGVTVNEVLEVLSSTPRGEPVELPMSVMSSLLSEGWVDCTLESVEEVETAPTQVALPWWRKMLIL